MDVSYTPERDFLVLLLVKDNFLAYYESLNLPYLKDNHRELYVVYEALRDVHAILPGDVSLTDLQAYFFKEFPDVDRELYLGLFKTLSEATIDPSLGVVMLQSIKERREALILSEAAFRFSNGNSTREKVNDAYERWTRDIPLDEDATEFVTTDITTIIDNIYKVPGLRWRLDSLNKSLGSLRRGNFGFLFARPEVGKTTFLASEISYMLQNLPDEAGSIIWFNNEQVGQEVMLRVYQGYFGVRLEQIRANPQKYKEEFLTQTKGRFKMVDNAQIDKGTVERLCKQLKPSLVIFDQIDKIHGFAADREDLRLGAIYIWARELAKTYCPVIAVCQADGSGEGQKWLTMDNVANAKTSKQAEADWILGMGHVHTDGMQFIRYLHLSKNKLMGDEDTIPRLRHGKLEVLIEPEIARFKDLIKYE